MRIFRVARKMREKPSSKKEDRLEAVFYFYSCSGSVLVFIA